MLSRIEAMNRFSIRDIENLTGIKAHTIRIWEHRYGILQPKRTPTNIRYYDAADLKMALRIALLNNYGYKISNIHRMTDADMNALIRQVTDSNFKLQLIVNELIEDTLTMNMEGFEALIDMHLSKYGMEHTVEHLLFHFLEKIGLMWMTDRIFPAQEHLVSNIIYRKLAVAIESLAPQLPKEGPTVLLFLPEGDIHDLGLMYVHYLLLKYQKKPIYLGPNTPIDEARFVYQATKPQYIYIHLTAAAEEFDGNKYMQKLHQYFPESTIFISGGMLRNKKYTALPNIKLLYSLQDVRESLIRI